MHYRTIAVAFFFFHCALISTVLGTIRRRRRTTTRNRGVEMTALAIIAAIEHVGSVGYNIGHHLARVQKKEIRRRREEREWRLHLQNVLVAPRRGFCVDTFDDALSNEKCAAHDLQRVCATDHRFKLLLHSI